MGRVFAVTGATGHIGGRVASQLLAAGHKVHAVVRNQTSPAAIALKEKGAQLSVADYSNVAGLTSAFTGVEAAFIMLPPNLTEPHPDHTAWIQALHLKEAIVASGLKRIVALSSVGGHQPSGTGVIGKLHQLEKELRTLEPKVSVTIIRPGYFAENTSALLPLAFTQHIFPVAVQPDVKVPFIVTQDIGDEVAKLLQRDVHHHPHHHTHIVELEGPEILTHNQLADIISDVIGQKIQLILTPDDKVVSTFEGFGLSHEGAKQVFGLAKGLKDGTVAYEGKHEHVKGTTTYKSFVQAAYDAFQKSQPPKV